MLLRSVLVAGFDVIDVKELTNNILKSAARALSGADLQTDVEHLLHSFFDKMGINYAPHHNITIIRGRPDTLYGRVIIEYKIPTTLKRKSKLEAAISEDQRNIGETAQKYREDVSSYVGIITDGYQITFTKFRRNQWITEPLADISELSITRLLEYLRGLIKKPLHPDFMVKDFGPQSELARLSVQKLYSKLRKSNPSRVNIRDIQCCLSLNICI
jgi:hypothetical protein